MTQSDLEWPRTAKEIVWMTQYDFRWVKSTSANPFWGPSDLDILIYTVTRWHLRERPPYCVPNDCLKTAWQLPGFCLTTTLSYIWHYNGKIHFYALKGEIIDKTKITCLWCCQQLGTANIFLKCPFWKLHNLKPRLSSAQLRVRNARNAFSFLSEMVHISRLWFSWHGEDKIKSLDVKTTRKWLLAVHTIQKSHNMIRAIYISCEPEIVRRVTQIK